MLTVRRESDYAIRNISLAYDRQLGYDAIVVVVVVVMTNGITCNTRCAYNDFFARHTHTHRVFSWPWGPVGTLCMQHALRGTFVRFGSDSLLFCDALFNCARTTFETVPESDENHRSHMMCAECDCSVEWSALCIAALDDTCGFKARVY